MHRGLLSWEEECGRREEKESERADGEIAKEGKNRTPISQVASLSLQVRREITQVRPWHEMVWLDQIFRYTGCSFEI